ncbi:hypothetical protein L1987_70609 [Smallanthus sonchifolius]|uniref:Uncharacterized protein n=1 Tax=Smallanthus sonchifolius TaxID=185202 RepID=A0ACB9AUG0_9ASTR|nr:hypothetical protein L1987_70609 [Smallanthus sonchifolius]
MLISPPTTTTTTTKLLPKLHHPPCRPSHFLPKQMRISQTKTSITFITTNNHRKTHTSDAMASENGGGGRITIWKAVKVAVGLDLMSRLLGINLSFHRHLTHKSFKIPKWLEYTFAYCGTQALQGSPIDWVRTHRFHHQYVDTEKDPHSPIKGFWFSHILWMFDTNNTSNMVGERNNVRDLEKQFFYRFVSRTYIAHPIALALVLYALGGLPFIVWGMGVRVVWGYHMTWLVNSTCHGSGNQTWDTRDLSLNNRWIGILGFGDGWHHNHHAFKYSARHGLEWWQVDITWYLIRLLEIIGLASDVKLPTPTDIQRKTFPLKASSP